MTVAALIWTPFSNQLVFVPPASPGNAQRSLGKVSVTATSMAEQTTNQDIVVNAVAAAAFDLWAEEYPAAAKSGTFMGQHASRQHIADRVNVLQDALSLDWAQVLGLVRADSRVLFVLSAKHAQQALSAVEAEVGSYDTAIDIIMSQPTLLLAERSRIQGKGKLLQGMAGISNVARPIYRAIKKSAIFPEPLEWDFGLP
jgi:hypothetical protein